MKKISLLTAGLLIGAAFFLLPACKMKEEPSKEDKELDRILTPEEVAKMSPEELEKYKDRIRRKKNYTKPKKAQDQQEKKSAIDTWLEQKKEKKAKMRDVSRPMSESDRGSAFPWRSTPQHRSEELHNSMDLQNRY